MIGIPLIHAFAMVTLVMFVVRGLIYLFPSSFVGRGLTVLYG